MRNRVARKYRTTMSRLCEAAVIGATVAMVMLGIAALLMWAGYPEIAGIIGIPGGRLLILSVGLPFVAVCVGLWLAMTNNMLVLVAGDTGTQDKLPVRH